MKETMGLIFPRPKKALLWLMVALGCLWVFFAAAINWAQAPAAVELFNMLAGSSGRVADGQVWRLLTAALLHSPSTPSHALVVLMMLFFFGSSLDDAWGQRRLMLFFAGAAVLAFGLQMLVGLVLPSIATDTWYGGMVLADAATVAWAFQNRGQVVRLFFVIPMRPLVMVALLAGWHVLLLIARSPSPEGHVAPFGAMLAGWLLCDASPFRRLLLRSKLRRMQREIDTMRPGARDRVRRATGPELRVIRGGSDEPPKKRMLH
ncbi:MAG: rhomboid family intramembrane serine protease [Myxococcales bacterium]|nr:rhomboid family intramembrane serine protease [Myxococcales bacterium]